MADKVKYKTLDATQICSLALDQELNGVVSVDGSLSMVGMHSDSLSRLIKFADLVLKTKKLAFEVTGSTLWNRRVKEVSKLAYFFRGFHSFYELYSNNVEYSPDVALVFRCIVDHPIRECGFHNVRAPITGEWVEADVFNDFIQVVRARADAEGTRKKMADWARNPNKNLARMRTYVNGLFEHYARLLVVRVDFLYKETSLLNQGQRYDANVLLQGEASNAFMKYWHGSTVSLKENFARIDVHTAKADITRFLRKTRGNPAFKYKVGYICKMEWSRWSGNHFHCVFFFDGSEVDNDYYAAKLVGEHWETVTGGRGFAHNCNQDKRKYRNWGIGRVDHYDQAKRVLLDQALSYLPKRDQYVRIKPSGKHRVFQTGVLKPLKKDKVGRPRSKVGTPVNTQLMVARLQALSGNAGSQTAD